jgi:hypothetical protein
MKERVTDTLPLQRRSEPTEKSLHHHDIEKKIITMFEQKKYGPLPLICLSV